MKVPCEPAVMLRDLRPGSAAARVAQEREVLALREADCVIGYRQLAELDEVIATAARAELRPRAVLHPRCHWCDVPVAIHHRVLVP
jgi:hypothetical protein